MNRHFDVAVVGATPAGILCAAMLARSGRSVALVDQGERPRRYRGLDAALPLGPEVWAAPPDTETGRRVAELVGLMPEWRASAVPILPTFQAIFDRHRFATVPDRNATEQEWSTEFPELGPKLSAWLNDLNTLAKSSDAWVDELRENRKRRWWQGKSSRLPESMTSPVAASSLWNTFESQHPLMRMGLGLLPYLTHTWPEQHDVMSASRAVASALRGLYTFPQHGLVGLLLKQARVAGVEVRVDTLVDAIETRGDAIASLRFQSGSQQLTADFVVASTAQGLAGILRATERGGAPSRAIQAFGQDSLRQTGGYFVTNWRVDRRVLPEALGPAALLFDGRQARAEDPPDTALLVRRFPVAAGTQSGPEPSDEILSVTCPVRFGPSTPGPDRLGALARQVQARVGRFLPFFTVYERGRSIPSEPSAWNDEKDDNLTMSDPWSLHPIFERNVDDGPRGRPIETSFRNLVVCSREVFPSLGLEGEFIAADRTFQVLKRRAGRRWVAK